MNWFDIIVVFRKKFIVLSIYWVLIINIWNIIGHICNQMLKIEMKIGWLIVSNEIFVCLLWNGASIVYCLATLFAISTFVVSPYIHFNVSSISEQLIYCFVYSSSKMILHFIPKCLICYQIVHFVYFWCLSTEMSNIKRDE